MPAVDWRPAWNADFGIATPDPLPPIVNWITKGGDGRLYDGANEFFICGTHTHEAGCGLDDAVERSGMPKRCHAKGATVNRMLSANIKVFPDGPWEPGSGGVPAPGDTRNMTFVDRVDETIYQFALRGIRTQFAFDDAGRIRIVNNLPRNVQTANQVGRDHGMYWSAEWATSYEGELAFWLDHVNPYRGLAWKNDPAVYSWMSFNENAIFDTFYRQWFDDIINMVGGTGGGPSGGSGYWRAELDNLFTTWATANSWIYPSTGARAFPLLADYNLWTDANQARMIEFLWSLESAAALRARTFIKARSPNCIFVYTQSSYTDARIAQYCDMVGRDSYAFMNSTTAFTPTYVTRDSSLKDKNAFFLGAGKFEERMQGNAIAEIETGSYTQTPLDATTCLFAAIWHNLQLGQGYHSLTDAQSKFQKEAVGMTLPHVLTAWPSRRLGELLASQIMRFRHIGSLNTARAYKVDPTLIPMNGATSGFTHATGYRFGNTGNGGEWSWLKRRMYTDYGTPHDVAAYTGIVDGNITTGVTIGPADGLNGNLFVRGADGIPTVRFDFPRLVGQAETVENLTTGIMTIAGLAASYPGVSVAVSMGNYPLFTGKTLFFSHGASYRTDLTIGNAMGGGSTEERFLIPGNTVTVEGTEAATRLWIPPSHTAAFTCGPQSVQKVNADGTGTPANWSYNTGTGRGTLTTDSTIPLYLFTPLDVDQPPEPVPWRPWSSNRGGVN